ncbi:MAG: hypothetical protein U9N59_12885 [Campylobacterota bacterium]|nr:hypothetical protein [Campylobacterota bacterium]
MSDYTKLNIKILDKRVSYKIPDYYASDIIEYCIDKKQKDELYQQEDFSLHRNKLLIEYINTQLKHPSYETLFKNSDNLSSEANSIIYHNIVENIKKSTNLSVV